MKIAFNTILFLTICLFYTNTILAQRYLTFIVKDTITNEPLAGASVFVDGIGVGAITDSSGYARLEKYPGGIFSIGIRMVGYVSKEIQFTSSASKLKDPLLVLLAPQAALTDEVIIMATRNNSRLENIPTNVEVLGMEDIQQESAVKPGNIASLFGDIAGLQMQQVSATSGNINVRIQGLNGGYTQILRDGIPLYGGFSGSFSILQIPPLDLRQVEIIKGSSSTLFGGDAISGIINLISRKPSNNFETSLLLNQTTLNETDANVFLSGYYRETGFTFFAGHVQQKPSDVNGDGFSDVPRVRNFVIHPNLFFNFDGNITLSVGLTSTFEERKGGDMDLFNNPVSTQHEYFVNHISARNSGDFNLEKKYDGGSSLSCKGAISFVQRSIETNQYYFSASQMLHFTELSYFSKGEKSDFVVGLNYYGNRFTKKNADSVSLPDYTQSTWGIFAQNDWRITEKLLIESGLRYDYNSQYHEFLLPHISVMYKLSSLFMIRLNGGYGYKTPELFSYINEEQDLQRVKLFNVRSELSKNINFDINYNIPVAQLSTLTLDQSFFYTILDHPIVSTVDTQNQIILFNADKPVETYGLQTYARLVVDELEFYLSYVFTHATKKYDDKNPVFLATPKHNVACIMMFDLEDGWRTGIDASYIGSQYIENNEKTPAYVFMAAMIAKKIDNFTIVLNCENVFNYRQKNYIAGNSIIPEFKTLWAPIDGRVLNISLNYKI